jgi:Protein of unknown function (DUF2842)
MRWRVLVGTAALVLGLAVYALAAMRLAVAVVPETEWVRALFYAAAGILWIFPAARLTRWMQAPR